MLRVQFWLVALARCVARANSNAVRLGASEVAPGSWLALGPSREGSRGAPQAWLCCSPGMERAVHSHTFGVLLELVLTVACSLSRRMTQSLAGDDGDRAGLDEVRDAQRLAQRLGSKASPSSLVELPLASPSDLRRWRARQVRADRVHGHDDERDDGRELVRGASLLELLEEASRVALWSLAAWC